MKTLFTNWARSVLTATVALYCSTTYAQDQAPEAELDAEASVSAAAVSGAVSFQGALEFGGTPASGSYDFILTVYSDPSAGVQVGSSHVQNNYNVVDGVFAILADFGNVDFWSGDRWIKVEVREGSSTGSYETLSPRTRVAATPLALALPNVYAAPDGSFVGVGRNSPVTGAERFGIHSPVTSGYAGMYISTVGSNGDPFYGYAPGGAVEAYTYFDGSTDKWHLNNGGVHLTVQKNGRVGIGTTTPGELLHVTGSDADVLIGDPAAEHILLEGNIGSGAIARFYTNQDVETVRINSHGTDATGQILMFTPDGLTQTVNINAVEAAGQGSQITLYNGNGTATVEIDADYGAGTGQPGRITVDELELNGSDLAEHFDIQPKSTLPEPVAGMVVSIDPDHAGDLMVSHESYDRKIVGVISGAGDIRTGIYMSQRGTIADGAHPVAVAGRVYVMANTENGPIRPGDMLTSSSRPGQAARVDDYDRARGAILGKAMTELESGSGLVLLFISQQ